MNQKTKALTILIALASSTAFAAGSSTQPVTAPQAVAPVIPAAPVTAPVMTPATTPVTPQSINVAPVAPMAGKPGPVCAPAPHPMKGQAPRPGAAPVAPGNTTAPAPKAPDAMKNAPARPPADGKAPANCGPLAAHRRGAGHPGAERPGAGHPGGEGRGGAAPVRTQGQTAPVSPGTVHPRAPRAQVNDATRTQNELTRIDALLTRTTDAKARGYLTDAPALSQSGNVRAAQSLIRAAEALGTTQK